jgi:hypothetical protein
MLDGNKKKSFQITRLLKNYSRARVGELHSTKSIWKTEEAIKDEKLDIGFGYNNFHIEEIRVKSTGDEYRLVNLKIVY